MACGRSAGVVGACCRKDGSGCTEHTEPGGISSPTCCSSDWAPASGCETCCWRADELDATLAANRRVGGSGDRERPGGRNAGVVVLAAVVV